jgi:uncharacterized protein (TIGR02266 family)
VPEQDPLERLRALASTPEEDHQNRRNTDRVPFKIKVEYVSGGTTVTEEAQDVSLKGMFIRTDTPLSVGDPLVVSLSLPESTATLTLPTRVKWVSAFGSLEHPRPGMGVEFTGLDDRRRRALETLLKPASKPPEDSDHYQP